MVAPDEVKELVDRFGENLDDYKGGRYNETQVRREFIDPFFTALGWDVANSSGFSEAYKDVVHEASLKVGGATKAPDYAFRIGGARKFFLEAKRPSVNIKQDLHPAYQLRRYAWSGKLPLSVLTDFEEFSAYDCRIRPTKNDKASTARIMYCTFDQYEDKWDEIASVFSREAILKGSFDRYVEDHRKKRGTSEVDEAFLEEIERCRAVLAKNIALRNDDISVRDLNFAVQKTIDRIVFLRICEDRDIEAYGRLQSLGSGHNVYRRLVELFRECDDRYNSGLFHFSHEKNRPGRPDSLTADLAIDDKVVKDILKRLYYPDSPYEFSVLPADILGQVYEQFLGNVIELTPSGRAKVEQRPEVKKAGGVYYTPTYIVEYIVQATVGRLLEGKVPKPAAGRKSSRAASLRVLDPACGSGSFLIGVYQHLLDWHLEWYAKNEPRKWARKKIAPIYQSNTGSWILTLNERKRILLDSIFGVDIDSQAVEVTKLSLLLKVLENQPETQVALLRERVLPDLGANIKCGNSLIGTDFYEGEQQILLGEETLHTVNAFDWQMEFESVFADSDSSSGGSNARGFDVVVGNPPYFNVDDTWGKGDPRQKYLKRVFPHVYNDKTDVLFYFLAKAVQLSQGKVGFIVSRAFLEAYKADKLRKWLGKHIRIEEIIDFRNYHVFSGVGITTAIVVLSHLEPKQAASVYRLSAERPNPERMTAEVSDFGCLQVPQSDFDSGPWSFVGEGESALIAKIDSGKSLLGDVLHIGQGMQTGCNKAFGNLSRDTIESFNIPTDAYYVRARNSDIERYHITDSGKCVLYVEDYASFESLPERVRDHLSGHRSALRERAAFKRGNCDWWRYTWPLHKQHMTRDKIYAPYLARRNRFALDRDNHFLGLTDTTVMYDAGQPEDLRFLLGLLNSRLLTYRFRSIGKLKSGGILEYFWNIFLNCPCVGFHSRTSRT